MYNFSDENNNEQQLKENSPNTEELLQGLPDASDITKPPANGQVNYDSSVVRFIGEVRNDGVSGEFNNFDFPHSQKMLEVSHSFSVSFMQNIISIQFSFFSIGIQNTFRSTRVQTKPVAGDKRRDSRPRLLRPDADWGWQVPVLSAPGFARAWGDHRNFTLEKSHH